MSIQAVAKRAIFRGPFMAVLNDLRHVVPDRQADRQVLNQRIDSLVIRNKTNNRRM